MSSVRLEKQKLWIGDESLSLLSGEIHYWRLNPTSWRRCLTRIREMGLNMVASYICWDFHEITEGQYDFNGATDPQRNLTAFLDLLTEEDFWVILRPGPYIYSEWQNNGVPNHAAEYHRLHPQFQDKVATYLDAVCAVIRPYLASNGGRVIMVQADNEIDPWPRWFTEQLGLGRQTGPFHDFLQERYGDITTLNKAWGSHYSKFSTARAVRQMQPEQPDRLCRYLDSVRFSHWYVNRVAQWGVNAYRERGIDVPIIVNTYSGTSTQNWAELEQIADLSGSDIYPSQEFDYRFQEHRHFMDIVRYAQAASRLPYIAEFEAGIWHDWLGDVKTLSANHYRLMCLSALLAGAAGWNWYMLVNRDNWYQSPINEWGNTRPDLFTAFQQITTLFNEVDPPTLTKLSNTAVTYSPLQRASIRPGQPLLEAFYEADSDYTFSDVENGHCQQPILFYAGGHWLGADAQQRLVDYVAHGGHLVCIGEYPRLDDALRPLNLLEIAEPDGIISSAPTTMSLDLSVDTSLGLVRSQWLFDYQTTQGTPIYATRLAAQDFGSEELKLMANVPTGDQYTVGYTEERGEGRLTMLGLAPTPAVLLALHDYFDVPIFGRSHTPTISTAIFQRHNDYYLIVVNNGQEAKMADIELNIASQRYNVRDLCSGATWQTNLAERNHLFVTLPRKDGTILVLQPIREEAT